MSSLSLSRAQRWALVLAATFTMTISYVDRQTLSVLAPVVTRELHISEQGYGWLASAFSVAYLVGAPLAGAWIDRVGARFGLLAAVLVWTVIAGLHALAPGFGALFALRVALGFAESPSFPGAAQTVTRALSRADRARGLGVLFTGSSIGAMLVPPLATLLMREFSWRAAFLGTAIAGLVWVPVWWACAWTPAARGVIDRPPEVAPDEIPRGSTRTVLAHPAMLRALVLVIASAPPLAFLLLWASKYLVQTCGVAQVSVGKYLWFPPLLYDLGSVTFGHLSSMRARRNRYDGSPDRALVAVAAALTMCVGLLAFTRDARTATVIAAVAMAGGAGLYALLTSDLMSRVPAGAVSTAGGLCAAAQSIAHIVFNPIIGAFAQRDGDYHRAVLLLAVWVIPGTLAWLLWSPPPAREDAV
jgi:ACS family hexuronate transporter-like MFS transporter